MVKAIYLLGDTARHREGFHWPPVCTCKCAGCLRPDNNRARLDLGHVVILRKRLILDIGCGVSVENGIKLTFLSHIVAHGHLAGPDVCVLSDHTVLRVRRIECMLATVIVQPFPILTKSIITEFVIFVCRLIGASRRTFSPMTHCLPTMLRFSDVDSPIAVFAPTMQSCPIFRVTSRG